MRFEPCTTPLPNINTDLSAPLTDDEKQKLLDWAKENSHIKTNNCWVWKGATNKSNNQARYGNQAAHAYIYKRLNNLQHQDAATVGRIHHTCDNPQCVNPEHCKLTVGRRTRNNIEETVDPTRPFNQYALIKNITKALLKDPFFKEIADAVVAELLRVKFDEIIAQSVVTKLQKKG